MKKDFFEVSCLFFITLFTLTIFSTVAQAQFFNNNEKLTFPVLSYAPAGYTISTLTRPRIYKKISSTEENVSNVESFSRNAVAPNYASTEALERRVFDLINQKRMQHGLQPVMWSDDVARVARLHSANMAKYRFFSHQGIDGKRVSNRAESMGVRKWRSLGENIAYSRGFGSPLENAIESWMRSSGHRENILGNQWQKTGVGIARLPNGVYYFTQVFLKN